MLKYEALFPRQVIHTDQICAAATYYWQRLHDEGYQLHEEPQAIRNVSSRNHLEQCRLLTYEPSPGFFSRLKEKGAMVKDAWGVIGSALGVQSVLIDMQKTLEKGEVPEEELRALESDVTGKVG